MIDWLTTLHPAVFVVVGLATYLFLAGLTHSLVTFEEMTDKNFSAVFWPLVWAGWVIYRIATAGPRMLKWRRDRKLAKDAPRARMIR